MPSEKEADVKKLADLKEQLRKSQLGLGGFLPNYQPRAMQERLQADIEATMKRLARYPGTEAALTRANETFGNIRSTDAAILAMARDIAQMRLNAEADRATGKAVGAFEKATVAAGSMEELGKSFYILTRAANKALVDAQRAITLLDQRRNP